MLRSEGTIDHTARPTTQAHRGMRPKAVTAVAALALAVGMVSTATPAHASDWGGVVDPANCTNNSTRGKAVPFKDHNGNTLGSLEIRWSDSCKVKWARITTKTSHKVNATIKQNDKNQAGMDEYGTPAWTRGISVSKGTRVCAYGDVYYGTWRKSAAVVCAS